MSPQPTKYHWRECFNIYIFTLANSHGMPKFHLFPLKFYVLVVKHHIQILESGQEWIKFDQNKKPLHSPPLKQSSTNRKQGLSGDQWERRSTARKLIQPLLVQVTALHSCKMSLKPHFRYIDNNSDNFYCCHNAFGNEEAIIQSIFPAFGLQIQF